MPAVYVLPRIGGDAGGADGEAPARRSGRDRASAQAERARRVLPLLTEEEAAVFRRGRNAHVNTVPHSASRSDYLTATALECLLGWLYLRGETDRINRLFQAMMEP